jgi:hypothetical protein
VPNPTEPLDEQLPEFHTESRIRARKRPSSWILGLTMIHGNVRFLASQR